MPAQPPPIADERAGFREYVAAQQLAFHAVAYGLTDEQARATPSASALSIGALIKHVTNCERGWMQRVAAAPEPTPADERSAAERAAEYEAEFVMGPDETLAAVLAEFSAVNTETLRLIDTVDLGAAVPVPRDAPWFPRDVDAWHADIIRESIDGATLYELVAALEGWEPTDWLTPWGATPVRQ
jgi:uncharacterized damage-inducible protein DinB